MKTLLGVYLVSTLSCAAVQTAGQNVLDCEEQQIPSIIESQVTGALTGQSETWQSDLDDLLAKQGPVVVCAVEKEVALLEHASMHEGATEAAITRGQAWLASENHQALVKH